MPTHWSVGKIVIDGLKVPTVLNPDEYDRYTAEDLPEDLFDIGDRIIVSAEGGDLAPFSLEATGVAELEVGSSTIELCQGSPVKISWTPANPDSRVRVVLLGGWHYPFYPSAALLCDAPDNDGEIEISAALVEEFTNRGAVFMKFSRITRYTRDAKILFGKEIELFVATSTIGLSYVMIWYDERAAEDYYVLGFQLLISMFDQGATHPGIPRRNTSISRIRIPAPIVQTGTTGKNIRLFCDR